MFRPLDRPSSHPAGAQAAVSSLRHFIHWRHPAVLLEELTPWEGGAQAAGVYQVRAA